MQRLARWFLEAKTETVSERALGRRMVAAMSAAILSIGTGLAYGLHV